MKVRKHKDYNYQDIEKYAELNGLEIVEHGNEYEVGSTFICLEGNNGTALSFVLTGATMEQGIYTLIYLDI